MLPKVGIIYLAFPTKQWQRDINRAMQSFEALDYTRDAVELIIVEPEKTSPRIKDWFMETWGARPALPRVHYVMNTGENIGFAQNNNVGFEKAKQLGCKYVHLTNQDADVDPDYLKYAVLCAERDQMIGAVQSLILLGEDRDRINSSGNAFHILGFGYSQGYKDHRETVEKDTVHDIAYASGAAVLVRVSALNERPLFDEKLFMYHEDTDLSLDLRSRGYRIVIESRSIVWHYYEFAKNKINYYWMERNRWVLILSYYRLWTLLLLMPIAILMEVGLILFSIKSGWFDMKWKQMREWGSLSFWRWLLARRKIIQHSRALGDRDLLKLAVSDIRFQEESVRNPILDYLGNPFMKAYWSIVKWFVI